jgi:hypothetical protein
MVLKHGLKHADFAKRASMVQRAESGDPEAIKELEVAAQSKWIPSQSLTSVWNRLVDAAILQRYFACKVFSLFPVWGSLIATLSLACTTTVPNPCNIHALTGCLCTPARFLCWLMLEERERRASSEALQGNF